MKQEPTKKGVEMICGVGMDKIRKAYFDKKLNPLFSKIQSEAEHPSEDVQKLGAFLESLRLGATSFVEQITTVFGGKVVDDETVSPPTVEELREGLVDDEWKEKAQQATIYIEKTFDNIRDGIKNNTRFNPNFWSDQACTFLSLQDILNKDCVYKDQLYRARLTKIIDTTGCSRAEAEERARITKEYFDKEVASKNAKRIEEFYTFARRRDDQEGHR